MKVLIASADEKWMKKITQMIQEEDTGCNILTALDGNQCMKILQSEEVNLVVMDYLISGTDVFSIVDACQNHKKKVEMMVAVPKGTEARLKVFSNYENVWLMEKHMEHSLFYSVLHGISSAGHQRMAGKELSRYIAVNHNYDKEVVVTNVLHDIGIPAHIKGYQYLRYAIMLAVNDMDILNAVTKQLYPEIAEKYKTTAQRVERAIRHAILIAWERGRTEQMMEYFSYTLKQGGGRPTNSEFIAMIADKIRLESKVKSA